MPGGVTITGPSALGGLPRPRSTPATGSRGYELAPGRERPGLFHESSRKLFKKFSPFLLLLQGSGAEEGGCGAASAASAGVKKGA